MSDPLRLGPRGEAFAARIYERAGYVIEARNYRTREGELDIVARKDGALCIVEVKTRADGGMNPASDSVGAAKRRRLVRAALQYVAETGFDGALRFEVFELYVRGERPVRYRILDCPMDDLEEIWLP